MTVLRIVDPSGAENFCCCCEFNWVAINCPGAEGVQLVQRTRGTRVLCRSRKAGYYFLQEIQSHPGQCNRELKKLDTPLCFDV